MSSFVEDGDQRAIKGIRAEIEAKYASELKRASRAERKVFNKKIDAEINEAAKKFNLRNDLF